MSSKTLSAVLERQIRHLCLNDFPCGYGGWRKTKDGADRAGTVETDTLLDLLSCPHSPWWQDESWSPQAPALRRLAVLTPDRLTADFIYNYFTTLRIVDKDVSVIDDGLLKFSKLEELVLSVNKISEIPVENLPSTLKVLELRANRLSCLDTLTKRPPPHLQYLSLGSNSLFSHQDISHLTGSHWPHLVCLDLSDCEFQDQQTLLNALSTLSCLKTLVLEGNPFTLASSYPGVTMDSLPQLSFLDASWISPEERSRFRGLADMRDLIVDKASAIVNVGRMRGLPDPLSGDENSPDLPVVSYSYSITYEFLSHQTPINPKVVSEPEVNTAATAVETDDNPRDTDLQSNTNCERQTSKPDTQDLVKTEETCHNIAYVSRHSTPKLAWSEYMDFADTQTYVVSDLGGLKKFLSQGLYLCIEEEKVFSWPAASDNVLVAKSSQSVKENKGRKAKDSPIKSGSAKGKSKDTKKKSIPELVQDTPIKRILGSVHVPLQSLVRGSQKVDILCELDALHKESQVEATQTFETDLGKKIKDDKKEDKTLPVGSGTGQSIWYSSKASFKAKEKEKDREGDIYTDNSMSVQLEPVTVEFSVELEKFGSASEAQQRPHYQTSYSTKPVL